MLSGAAEVFKEVRKKQYKQKLLLGNKWMPYKGLDDLVFTSPTGYPINNSMICNQMKTIVKRIQREYPDFPYITFHTLRHTFATRCIENYMQPQVLKTIMGHSKLSITMDLYAHVLDDEKTKAMELVESQLDFVSIPKNKQAVPIRKYDSTYARKHKGLA